MDRHSSLLWNLSEGRKQSGQIFAIRNFKAFLAFKLTRIVKHQPIAANLKRGRSVFTAIILVTGLMVREEAKSERKILVKSIRSLSFDLFFQFVGFLESF